MPALKPTTKQKTETLLGVCSNQVLEVLVCVKPNAPGQIPHVMDLTSIEMITAAGSFSTVNTLQIQTLPVELIIINDCSLVTEQQYVSRFYL